MNRIPFTQLFETVQKEWVRDGAMDTSTESIYKGHINYAYTSFLPNIVNEEFLRKSSFITTKADYSTGTVDISASGTTVDKGDTATSWTSANSNGFLFRETSSDLVARVTYTSATQLTFQNSLAWPHDAVDEGSYQLVLDRYALASDFDRMMRDTVGDGKVVNYFLNGGSMFLDPLMPDEFKKNFYFSHGTPSEYTVEKDFASGTYYLYINPPDTTTRTIFYSYIPRLSNLTEYTTGTVTATAASTAVTGSSTDFDGNIDIDSYEYYFRLDADGTGSKSLWFKVASVSGDTGLVLSSAYSGANAGAGKSYTIATVSKYPADLDRTIMLLSAIMADPDSKMKQQWMQLYLMDIQAFTKIDMQKLLGMVAKVDVRGRK